MALGKNSGPAGLPPHMPDHGASGDTSVGMGEHHDLSMLGQTGHTVTAGPGYEISGSVRHTMPPVRPPAVSDEYDRGF